VLIYKQWKTKNESQILEIENWNSFRQFVIRQIDLPYLLQILSNLSLYIFKWTKKSMKKIHHSKDKSSL
jgi:hypothetical protein